MRGQVTEVRRLDSDLRPVNVWKGWRKEKGKRKKEKGKRQRPNRIELLTESTPHSPSAQSHLPAHREALLSIHKPEQAHHCL